MIVRSDRRWIKSNLWLIGSLEAWSDSRRQRKESFVTKSNSGRYVPFHLHQLIALALVALTRPAPADQVCDEFPDVHTKWSFRVPKCGPEFSLTERDGYARLRVPDGALSGAGNYDSWSGADMAPTLERTDMGSGDWTITTRLDFVNPVLGTTYHAALMFRFGPPEMNDIVYWGEYTANGTLAVERVGNNIRPIYPIDPGPVSIQVQKIGDEYHFRHRSDDGLDWIEDLVDSARFLSPEPVTAVGLIGTTWGVGPEVIADFDYFCLEVPNVTLPTAVVTDPIPAASPITGLVCDKLVNGSLALSWSVCPGSETPVVVKIS